LKIGKWLDQKTASQLFSELHQITRHYRTVFLRIEPLLHINPVVDQILQQHRFRVGSYTNQPRATIIIDLAPELDHILNRMHQKTLYNIRYAEKKGVTVRMGGREDLTALNYLMQALGRQAGFLPRGLDYLKKEWETFFPLGQLKMFVASYKEKILAIHVCAVLSQHAVYLHGASSDENKNLMPNHLLIWEGIKWAKSNGCTTFDL
jgi:lipid II:glycine glycyltransferase (peptidoglycan interpeptide bridge formation enzyme)